MHKEFLLVDGYNMVHAWDNLKELQMVSLESARQKLLDILSNYQGFRDIIVIVVFDAYLVKGSIGSASLYNNIYVVYTKEAETADNYIEKVVRRLPKHYRVRVATSDALEQLIIMGQGATRISARGLWEEIHQTEKKIRSRYIENKPPKNNMLGDLLDEEAALWLEEMRRKK